MGDQKRPWLPRKAQVVAVDVAGRVPPHNTDAEAAVLSAVLTEERAFDLVADILSETGEEFYTDAHRRIYEAAVELKRSGQPVDTQTVAAYLRDRDRLQAIGGLTFLTYLVDKTPAVAHVAAHAKIIKQKWRVRRLIEACQMTAAEGYGDYGEPQAYIDSAEQRIYQIARDEGTTAVVSIYDVLHDAYRTLQEALTRGETITGTSSGFKDVDEMTSGMHPGELIVVAGRPGMGKTSYVLNIAVNVAAPVVQQVPGEELSHARELLGVMVFSLEMPKEQLAHRVMCSEGRIDLNKLRKMRLTDGEWDKMLEATNWLSKLPIWFDDTSAVSLLELRAKVRRQQAEFNKKDENGRYTQRLGLVVVDYLQLMADPPGAANREQAVSENSRGLKALAKELGLPVIALSQLNRAVESRGKNKRPLLSDLRECVAADALIMDAATGARMRADSLIRDGHPRVVGMSEAGRLQSPLQVAAVWTAGKKTIFRVRTSTGREVRCSDKHRFLTIDGWKPLRDLLVGDEIAAPRRLPEPTQPENALTKDEVRLIGYLISDGSYIKHRSIGYTKGEVALCDEVKRIALARFGLTPKGAAHDFDLTNGHQGPGGNPLMNWLRELGIHGQRGEDKRVPDAIFRCSNDIVAQFVATLWAGDGSIVPRKSGGWYAKFTSTSRGLLFDLQHLLLRLGVISIVGRPGRNTKSTMDIANLIVSDGDQMALLASAIDIPGVKGERLREAGKWAATERQRDNAHVDRLPLVVTQRVLAVKEAAGLSWAQLGYRCQGKKISRKHLLRACDGLERHGANPDVVEQLRGLARSDVLWDPIVEVTKEGIEETYDLAVPATQNFIVNDVLTHNSGAVEQDADVIQFVYRPEYYISDKGSAEAQKLKGYAEIILAKQRNGPTGKAKVTFVDYCARFENRDNTMYSPGDDDD